MDADPYCNILVQYDKNTKELVFLQERNIDDSRSVGKSDEDDDYDEEEEEDNNKDNKCTQVEIDGTYLYFSFPIEGITRIIDGYITTKGLKIYPKMEDDIHYVKILIEGMYKFRIQLDDKAYKMVIESLESEVKTAKSGGKKGKTRRQKRT